MKEGKVLLEIFIIALNNYFILSHFIDNTDCLLLTQPWPSQSVKRSYSTDQARYFGETLHLEKCILFRVKHVVVIDGYSQKIDGFITIPTKQ